MNQDDFKEILALLDDGKKGNDFYWDQAGLQESFPGCREKWLARYEAAIEKVAFEIIGHQINSPSISKTGEQVHLQFGNSPPQP